jgi:hypothetical protein
MCCAKPLRLFSVAVSSLSVLVPSGGGDLEYSSVAYSTSVHSAEVTDMKSFSPSTQLDSLVIWSALTSSALFGAPNSRNYLSHSTMRILQEIQSAAANDVIVHIIVKYKYNFDAIALE